jgi:hypothetical protein
VGRAYILETGATMNRAILLASALLLALPQVGEVQQIPVSEAGATHRLAIGRPGQPDYLLVVEIPPQRVQGDRVHGVLGPDGGAPVRAVGVIKRGAAGPAAPSAEARLIAYNTGLVTNPKTGNEPNAPISTA